MNHRDLTHLIAEVVAPILGDYVKECRAMRKELEQELRDLRKELEQAQRELVMLRTLERSRAQREMVAATARTDIPEDAPELITPGGEPLFATESWLRHRDEQRG